jgi:hypothetical protein
MVENSNAYNFGKPGHFEKGCSLPDKREKHNHFVGAIMTRNVQQKGYNHSYNMEYDGEPSEKFLQSFD